MEGGTMRLLSPTLFILLALSSAALADDCADQSQNGLNQCADAGYKKADEALNSVYREVTRRLKDDPPTIKLLVTAQKAWIAFRDAECTFSSAANAGGSIYPMVYAGCLQHLTEARTKRLRACLKGGEEDLDCPVPNP
jgi:uncharacterized protein YecT (DUF1311 family)